MADNVLREAYTTFLARKAPWPALRSAVDRRHRSHYCVKKL